jgi:hypothetical protein
VGTAIPEYCVKSSSYMGRKFYFFALCSINTDVWKTGYEDGRCMKLALDE